MTGDLFLVANNLGSDTNKSTLLRSCLRNDEDEGGLDAEDKDWRQGDPLSTLLFLYFSVAWMTVTEIQIYYR